MSDKVLKPFLFDYDPECTNLYAEIDRKFFIEWLPDELIGSCLQTPSLSESAKKLATYRFEKPDSYYCQFRVVIAFSFRMVRLASQPSEDWVIAQLYSVVHKWSSAVGATSLTVIPFTIRTSPLTAICSPYNSLLYIFVEPAKASTWSAGPTVSQYNTRQHATSTAAIILPIFPRVPTFRFQLKRNKRIVSWAWTSISRPAVKIATSTSDASIRQTNQMPIYWGRYRRCFVDGA